MSATIWIEVESGSDRSAPTTRRCGYCSGHQCYCRPATDLRPEPAARLSSATRLSPVLGR